MKNLELFHFYFLVNNFWINKSNFANKYTVRQLNGIDSSEFIPKNVFCKYLIFFKLETVMILYFYNQSKLI